MTTSHQPLFPDLERVPYLGPDASDPLAYRWYEPGRVVAGRSMADHLRPAVCYWHTLCWPGTDMFGDGTFERPWLRPSGDPMTQALMRLEAAFEIVTKLGVPFFCFHDRDLAPEGSNGRETAAHLAAMVDAAAAKMDATGVRLLWGTANLFSHSRYASGAATNPDPEVFAFAAAQVKQALEATHRLGGENYVLWGGREGYDTLLHTDLRRELDQLARFLHLVVEHKHKIGFAGTLLVEPKPHEPTKHQYDHDCAAVHAFLERHRLVGEVKLNIEVNHATLAGHSFHHEVAYALAHDLFGSVDANRGDPQNGWDTDQFPNDAAEWTLALYEILRAGGLSTGGFNFDAKLRRQSVDPHDLLHAHIGGLDTLAEALLRAARLLEEGELQRFVAERYAGWDGELGRDIVAGRLGLEALGRIVAERGIAPRPRSGRQELLENLVRNCRSG
ncbi:MAG TPA: xylose isomerase [Thermoanaerobaculia bacterium]|nr:xylose isomerase [Thermoanaerobaculia bacterium]